MRLITSIRYTTRIIFGSTDFSQCRTTGWIVTEIEYYRGNGLLNFTIHRTI